jgi:hypothetical protein
MLKISLDFFYSFPVLSFAGKNQEHSNFYFELFTFKLFINKFFFIFKKYRISIIINQFKFKSM